MRIIYKTAAFQSFDMRNDAYKAIHVSDTRAESKLVPGDTLSTAKCFLLRP